MKKTSDIAAALDRLVGEGPVARFRLFELAFSGAFLVYMGRNLLHPLEWLTDAGFHLSPGLQRPGALPPFPTLPTAAVPLFVLALLAAGWTVACRPRRRRLGFGALALLALYAEGVDSASAFALNKIFGAGFVFLCLAPGYEGAPPRGSLASVRGFQAMLMTLYVATGFTKVWDGNWLDHQDVVWSHAQGYYCTDIAAFLLRNLPSFAWTAQQYAVLAFELGAPLWFSWRRTRPFAIAFGLSFHLGIALMMKAVWVFSLQMAAFYTLFLPEPLAARMLECRAGRRSSRVLEPQG
jgi:hypothetical protein